MRRLALVAFAALSVVGEPPPALVVPPSGPMVAWVRDSGGARLVAAFRRAGPLPDAPAWKAPADGTDGPPALVGAPNAVSSWSAALHGYARFAWSRRERRAVVWSTGRDGALQARDAASGALLARVPLAVDGALAFDDAFVDARWARGGMPCPQGVEGDACQWRTLLAARTPAGGLHMLDVTNPDPEGARGVRPLCLAGPAAPAAGCLAPWPWTVFHRDPPDGGAFTLPAFGRLRMAGGRERAVVAVGVSDPRRHEGSVLVLDAASGETLATVSAASDAPRRIGEVGATPAAVDTDADGFLDLLVFGDRDGALWTARLGPDGPSARVLASLAFDGSRDPRTAGPLTLTPAVVRQGGALHAAFVTGAGGGAVVRLPLGGGVRVASDLATVPGDRAPLLGGCALSPPARREGWLLALPAGESASGGLLALSGYLYLVTSPGAGGARVRRLALENGDPCFGGDCCGAGEWKSGRAVEVPLRGPVSAPAAGFDEEGVLRLWVAGADAAGRAALAALPVPLRAVLGSRRIR